MMAEAKPARRPGFHGRLGAGRSSALVVVDMSLGFTDPQSPLGARVDGVVDAVARLLEGARRVALPVVFTTIAYPSEAALESSPWYRKVPALATLRARTRSVEIDPRVAPLEDEVVLAKTGASAFFGTPLASLLTGWGVDTLVVCGLSTSGCVRATVVDAIQCGFRPLVVTDAVGDRDAQAHAANLRDIDTKYGDLVTVDEVVRELGPGGDEAARELGTGDHVARELGTGDHVARKLGTGDHVERELGGGR
jgi:maleamate amidohydrolase